MTKRSNFRTAFFLALITFLFSSSAFSESVLKKIESDSGKSFQDFLESVPSCKINIDNLDVDALKAVSEDLLQFFHNRKSSSEFPYKIEVASIDGESRIVEAYNWSEAAAAHIENHATKYAQDSGGHSTAGIINFALFKSCAWALASQFVYQHGVGLALKLSTKKAILRARDAYNEYRKQTLSVVEEVVEKIRETNEGFLPSMYRTTLPGQEARLNATEAQNAIDLLELFEQDASAE